MSLASPVRTQFARFYSFATILSPTHVQLVPACLSLLGCHSKKQGRREIGPLHDLLQPLRTKGILFIVQYVLIASGLYITENWDETVGSSVKNEKHWE